MLATAGANGAISSTGNGYWGYQSVMLSWGTPKAAGSSSSGGRNILGIALGAVLGGAFVLLIVGIVWFFRSRSRRRRRAAGDKEQGSSKDIELGECAGVQLGCPTCVQEPAWP